MLTLTFGNSAETLYLYLLGAMIRLLGPTTLAVQLRSWGFAIACIYLLVAVVRRIDPRVPFWIPLAVGASSVWLFHYARSGLRAIASPFFLLLFALLLERMEREPASRWRALAGAGCSGYRSTPTPRVASCRSPSSCMR